MKINLIKMLNAINADDDVIVSEHEGIIIFITKSQAMADVMSDAVANKHAAPSGKKVAKDDE